MLGRRSRHSADLYEKHFEFGDAAFQGQLLIVESLASLAHAAPLFRRHLGEARDRIGDAPWVFWFANQSGTGLGHQLRGIAADRHDQRFARRHVCLGF